MKIIFPKKKDFNEIMRMMKQLLLFILSCFYGLFVANAQQLPLYALDPELHGLINPASVYCDFLNHERVLSAGIAHRSQWTGFPKEIAPSTQVGHGEYINLGEQHNIVLGGYFQHDRAGITENTGVYGRFAYIFTQGDAREGGVSFGLNFGLVNWQLKTGRLSLAQLDDPNFPLDNPSVWYPDIGMGVYAYKKLGEERGKYVYFGVSAPRFFDIRNSSDKSPERYPHIYALAGFHYAPANGSTVEVSTWIRQLKNMPMQASLNTRVQLLKRVTLGIGLVSNLPKFNDTPFLTFEVGTNLTFNEKYIGKIAYVRTFSNAAYWGSTHEINVSFALETD
jgi:type IX secretion system PorP/SprF family membrane protein